MTYNTGNPLGSADPRDLYDNAQNLDEAVNADDDQFTDRLGNLRPTLKGAIDPTGLATSAANSAQRAESAADSATVNADVYDDVAAGLAGTSDSEQFQVVEGEEVARYRNESGSAAEVARYPASELVNIALDVASQPGLLSGEFHSDDEPGPALSITDDLGNALATWDEDGFQLNQSRGEFYGDDDMPAMTFAITDENGNAFAAWDEYGRLITDSVAVGDSHTVGFAFAEPWSDPSENLVITWASTSADATVIEYRLKGASDWHARASRRSRAFPGLAGYYLHSALVDGLSPGSIYDLRFPGAGFTDSVRTCPIKDVRLVVASDYQNTDFDADSLLSEFGAVISAEDVDLLIFNGDFIDDNGVISETTSQRWFDFMKRLTIDWRTGGALIPMSGTMGNHEGMNAAGTSNAMSGGDGTPGQMPDIFSLGFDQEHPDYINRSIYSFSVGKELFVVALETDHTVPLPDQVDWLAEQLADNAPHHRHVCVVGHSPGFHAHLESWTKYDTQARTLRNEIWPIMSQYADKLRVYWSGHEHRITATERLVMDYDESLSAADNDYRWREDAANGVRQLGSGTLGGSTNSLMDIADDTSSIDGSMKFMVAASYDPGTSAFVVKGSDSQTFQASGTDYYNLWLADFSAAQFSAKCLNRNGHVFYEINESIGA